MHEYRFVVIVPYMNNNLVFYNLVWKKGLVYSNGPLLDNAGIYYLYSDPL